MLDQGMTSGLKNRLLTELMGSPLTSTSSRPAGVIPVSMAHLNAGTSDALNPITLAATGTDHPGAGCQSKGGDRSFSDEIEAGTGR